MRYYYLFVFKMIFHFYLCNRYSLTKYQSRSDSSEIRLRGKVTLCNY